MSFNYVLIIFILLLILIILGGYRIGAARMLFCTIVCAVAVFAAAILDSAIYRVLDIADLDKTLYGITGKSISEDIENKGIETYSEKIENEIYEQTEYIEKMAVPNFIKLSLMENNNSRVYEYLKAESFVEYTGKYLAYIIMSAISFAIAFIIACIAAVIFFNVTGVRKLIVGEEKKNRITGAVMGAVFGIAIIYILLACSAFLMNTELGVNVYLQIKSNHLLNWMYENNIVIKGFLITKAPVWLAAK